MAFRRRFASFGFALAAVLLSGWPLRAAAHWNKVSSPHFTIYTDGPTDDARDWAVNLEAFEQSLQQLFPLDDRSLAPITIVLFRSDREFRPFRLLKSNGRAEQDEAGIFLEWNGRFVSAVSESDEDTARRIVFINVTHWYMGAFLRPLPLWLETGLAEVYSTASATDGNITVGYPIRECEQALEEKSLLPLHQLLNVQLGTAFYKDTDNAAFFNDESWGFVHYLLQGKEGKWRPNLQRLVRLYESGMDQMDAFAAAFPVGIEKMEHGFYGYAGFGVYGPYVIATDSAAIARSVSTAPAIEAEVQAALGYLYLRQQRTGEAIPYILRAAALAPDNVRVLEAQADLALARGDNVRAIDFYRQAAAAGSRFYLAHYWPAAQDANSLIGGGVGEGFDPGAARTAADAFERTINLRPTFIQAYESLGGIAAVLGAARTPQDALFLQQGGQVAPGDPWIETGLAALATADGRLDDAHRILARDSADVPTALGGDPGTYRRKVAARLTACEELAELRKIMAAGGGETALPLLAQLTRSPLLPEERRQLGAWRAEVGAEVNLAKARAWMQRRQWMDAELLLNDLLESDAPATLQAQAKQLLAEVERQKAASP